MAEDDLVVLRKLLSDRIDSEATVVYFLVEVRKILDGMNGQFEVLKFFCDWILHRRLEWANAKNILRAFDNLLGLELRGAHRFPKILENNQYVEELRPLTSMRYLVDDLFVFLGLHRLDTSLVGNLERWGTFLGLYVEIISRTPLSPKDSGLQHLDTIRVKKSQRAIRPAPVQGDIFMFAIDWSFLKDGRERMGITNEIWFPAMPLITRRVIARLENRDGAIIEVPQDSKAFWKTPK